MPTVRPRQVDDPAGRRPVPRATPGTPSRLLSRKHCAVAGLSSLLALSACTGAIGVNGGTGSSTGSDSGGSGGGSNPGSGTGGNSNGSGSGGKTGSGSGGSGGSGPSSGSGGSGPSTGSGGTTPGGTGSGGATTLACNGINPGRAPLRRLTTYEYNNTIRDLLGDTSSPGSALPPQVDTSQNLFGNDADEQSPSSLLIEKYQSVGEAVAQKATASTTALGKLHTCASSVTTSTEEACARSIATALAPKAYRRTVATTEIDELVTLYKGIRALASSVTFGTGVQAMIQAMLQAPEFLYRVEQGTPVTGNNAVKRVGGREMATRLSYFFWQTMPDAPLFQAADAGMLDTSDGVMTQAKKMLDDPRSHPMMAFFFDNLLPLPDLSAQTRSTTLFPSFSSSIGSAMRAEVQRVLEYEIYENTSQVAAPYTAGSWPAILTLPYTFVNEALFNYYGSTAFASGTSKVTGTTLTKVNLNTSQRRGLLTLGGMMTGLTTTDLTNPVLRGSFIINKLMCRNLSVPAGLNPTTPDPYSGKTARERYGLHSAMATCAACHKMIDPLGLPFENFDAVGQYRTAEHWVDPNTQMAYDTPIDASGSVTGVDGSAANGAELVSLLAKSDEVQSCFADHWLNFVYGRSLGKDDDACNRQSINTAFSKGGYNVKQLLLALTQTDGFLYRPAAQ